MAGRSSILSPISWLGTPLMGHSGAARAGMVNFTKTAAFGVVGLQCSGQCRGSRMDRLLRSRPLSAGDAGKNSKSSEPCSRRTPRERRARSPRPSVALLSEAAAFISGATLEVDGAAPAAPRSAPMPPGSCRRPPSMAFHLASTPMVLRTEWRCVFAFAESDRMRSPAAPCLSPLARCHQMAEAHESVANIQWRGCLLSSYS